MATPVATYAFINAKLRGRIGKLLNEDFFRRAARAPSFTEAIGTLESTAYASALEAYRRTGDLKQVELELLRNEWAALSRMARFTPSGISFFVEAILRQYEVATAKHALRLYFEANVLRRAIDDKVAYLDREGPLEPKRLEAVINASSDAEALAAFSDKPYADALEVAIPAAREKRSLFAAETALDRWYFAQLIEAAESLDRRDAAIALRLFGIQIDLHNVNWAVRMRRYATGEAAEPRRALLPGGRLFSVKQLRGAIDGGKPQEAIMGVLAGRYGELTVRGGEEEEGSVRKLTFLEEFLRHILFYEVRRILGGYPFTVGIILSYYLLVQNEVRLVISVLNAKYYDMPPEWIEGLL